MATFIPDNDGKLFIVTADNCLDSLERISDYPVISVDEAIRKFRSGKYQTNVPFSASEETFIGKIELVYRNTEYNMILLPYYRFYIRLPEDMNEEAAENGVETYGAYYVPAVADEYITYAR